MAKGLAYAKSCHPLPLFVVAGNVECSCGSLRSELPLFSLQARTTAVCPSQKSKTNIALTYGTRAEFNICQCPRSLLLLKTWADRKMESVSCDSKVRSSSVTYSIFGSAQQTVRKSNLRGFLESDVLFVRRARWPFLTKMARIRKFAWK